MKVKYSPDVDILVLELEGGKIDHAEERDGVIAHFDCEGSPVLFEIQGAKNFLLGSFASMVNNEEVEIP